MLIKDTLIKKISLINKDCILLMFLYIINLYIAN